MTNTDTPDAGTLPPMPAATLGLDEAAAYLGIAAATLYTWRSRRPGYGPRAVKVGGRVRYRLRDLDVWLDEHTETGDPAVDFATADSARGRAPAHNALGSMTRRRSPAPGLRATG